jgi:hypothetical protein
MKFGRVRKALPGDLTLSPLGSEFAIGEVAADGGWHFVGCEASWQQALRKSYLLSLSRGAQVLATRDGPPLRVLDAPALWFGASREWHLHTLDVIERVVPAEAGVYVLRASGPIMIGETDDLRRRLTYHLTHLDSCPESVGVLDFAFEEISSAARRTLCMSMLIDWWQPPCNVPS